MKARDKRKLERMIYEKGLRDRVFLLSYKEEVEKYYQISHLCLVPSKETEAFPRVAIEALTCGCALVVSNVGGIRKAVLEGENGYVFRVVSHLAHHSIPYRIKFLAYI